ncbi:FGGY family carbohydrate kinase [Microbacterium invictum]|uniref:Sugar (Pentulose or hexulose) kinase n=1 Tax=Microbacterium invictum TaxID=515415 RepID=A0AA40SR39_9MICO|nr:FGGY family carbohydrate kinase [Microbacterium invictum]MBB4140841.1 sugar (pentulose or hexulose) kinase [Microbacterium invictum]
MSATVTVDIGTTGVKLCLFTSAGHLAASDRHPTPTVEDQWGEIYDLDALTHIIESFILGLDTELRASVGRIAFTSVGESGGLVRADLSLASPMILWHDHRGAEFLDRLDAFDRTAIHRIAGLPANANYGVSKTAWAKEHATDAQDAQWLNIAEYVAARFTGERWAEWSLASRTMALDLERREWSEEITSMFELPVSVFPGIRSARDGIKISDSFAATLHLSSSTTVHVAGHDHMVGAAGADLQPGELLNSTGTTEGLLFLQDRPSTDVQHERSKLANGVACAGDLYTLFASIPTGGSAFATLQGMLNLSESQLITMTDELHAAYLAGHIELATLPLVLPQFRGSPPPDKDATARGVISGVHSGTTARDLVFTTFLGLVLQFADVLALFGIHPQTVKVIGPASRNSLWLQLKADLLNTPLSVSQFPEVVSRGAHALASGQPTLWSDTDPRTVLPDADRHVQLAAWSEHVRPQWEHLKATPTTSYVPLANALSPQETS